MIIIISVKYFDHHIHIFFSLYQTAIGIIFTLHMALLKSILCFVSNKEIYWDLKNQIIFYKIELGLTLPYQEKYSVNVNFFTK